MANLSKTTTDHEEIRSWAEARGGKPAHVKGTGSSEDIGILRIEFSGYSGAEPNLEPISWEEFFEKFDERGLSLIYQEETSEGARSNFNKLVSAETAAESERGARASKSRASRSKKAAKKKSAAKAASASDKRGAAKRGAAKKGAKKSSSQRAGRKTSSPKKKTAKKKSATKKRR